MKKALLLLLSAAVLCVFLGGCSRGGKVHIRVFVPDSETGVSGTLFEGDRGFPGDTVTVDSVMASLDSQGLLEYRFDGVELAINGLEFFKDADDFYMRGWSITVNGTPAADGVFTRVRDGDVIEIVYEFIDVYYE